MESVKLELSLLFVSVEGLLGHKRIFHRSTV